MRAKQLPQVNSGPQRAHEVMKHVIHDIISFFGSHWPHLVVAVPAAIVFTAVHEVAHCAAVWVQGGRVTDFVWLPSQGEWGHMQYLFPAGAQYDRAAVSLAPYACWIGVCLLAGLLSLKRAPWSFRLASTIFVWLFIVPVGDVANAAIPYIVWDAHNDFRNAFGPAHSFHLAVLVAFGVMVAGYGFILNKRLYRDRAVRLVPYGVLVAVAAFLIYLLTSTRWVWKIVNV